MALGRKALFIASALLILCSISVPGESSSATTGGGRMIPLASVSEDMIWRADSGNAPNSTTVTLTVSGGGTKGITLAPQDIVFLMDHSGSLGTYDPQVLRILATHRYVDNMVAPYDRASVIKFDSIATTFNHLTSAYAQVHADLEALAVTEPQGQTNFQDAIVAASDELVSQGVGGNQKIILFFTDGTPDPPEKNVTMGQMDNLVMNGIKVYTIGLGPVVDSSLLGWMANYTGGIYYPAKTAEELVDIYLEISSQFYDHSAGSNCTLFADLASDLDYVEGSYPDHVNFTSVETGGAWRLVWTVGSLLIGENWSVTFNVTSSDGNGKVRLFQSDSSIEYTDWRGEEKSARLPEVYVTVLRGLPPPLPPPPTPPPPASIAPIPPPPSVPVVAPTVNVAPVITATPNVVPITIGQAGSVPVEYMLAGLAALGIAERIKIRKKIIEKQRVSVGA